MPHRTDRATVQEWGLGRYPRVVIGVLHGRYKNWTIPCVSNKLLSKIQFSCSVLSDSATPWVTAPQASLSITNSRSLLKPMSIESVMPSSPLILCRPLLLPPIPPSIRVFSNESVLCIRWPKYWSFSFSMSPSSEHPGLMSFRILEVQGTLKTLQEELISRSNYTDSCLAEDGRSTNKLNIISTI